MVAVFFLYIFGGLKMIIMKYIRVILVAAILFSVCSAFKFPFLKFKKQSNIVYAYGVSASFKDSVVYFTELQVLDSVKLENGLLPRRYEYSQQLKTFMEESMHQSHETCIIFFGRDKETLQKNEKKLRQKYLKDHTVTVKAISAAEFKFKKPSDES